MTKIIGLTGGIGSGKTTVAHIFKDMGIPVYIADQEAKKISDTEEVIQEIKKKFGLDIFENNILNRKKLATIVFKDKKKLAVLNQIIHPKVREHFDNWLKENSTYRFVIKEVAILFETNNDKNCDYVITVTAPLETRIQRIMLRDNLSREEIVNRINNQWSDQKRIEKSDFVIQNTTIAHTNQQVNEILILLNNT